MSKNQMSLDMQMPDLTGKGNVERKFAMISDYLFELAEHQRYLFSNLDARNFNPAGLNALADQITKPVYGKIEGLGEEVAELKMTAEEMSVSIKDLTGSVSQISQKVDSIRLEVKNGDTSSRIELKAGGASISSANISFRGMVTFNDLKSEGATIINGSNITTGTLKADYINLSGKFKVFSGSTAGGYLGYMEGNDGAGRTKGIGICNMATDCYVIITESGVAIQTGGKNFYMTSSTPATFRTDVRIQGDVTVTGSVHAADFIRI